METKLLEVRDRATTIPVLAIRFTQPTPTLTGSYAEPDSV